MKKLLLLLCLSILSVSGIKSQDWSVTLNSYDGLPGEYNDYNGSEYLTFNSKVFTPGYDVDVIRITVTGTKNNEAPNGNNVIFALSGLNVYDGNGNEVTYTASSNADHNTLTESSDGEGLSALSDNNIKSYFHSMWGEPAVTDYHYIEVKLSRIVTSFSLEWTTRLEVDKNAPTVVGITLGTEYVPKDYSEDLTLGDAVTTEDELATDGQLFVLKGNNTFTSFTTPNGDIYTGSGPIFMQCAEKGDVQLSQKHIMQLIPYKESEYLVYWPVADKFLMNSYENYNGLNGWQYSTDELEKAATVSIYAVKDGYFEMKYDIENKGNPVTIYIGAEMRDGAYSKMKIFDSEHKEYLENGEYTHGYSLPIAFNWSIYKADIDNASVRTLTMQQIAERLLNNTINKVSSYIGSCDKYCQNGENILLEERLEMAHAFTTNATNITVYEIYQNKEELLDALAGYVATKLVHYSEQVNTISSNAKFSSYPNQIKDTYPESSRSILESLQATISNAQKQTHSVEEYEAIYSQIERDIEIFESTRITETTMPEDKEDEDDENITDKDVIFVYLSNGDIDAFELSDIDGEYYVEDGKLHIPLQNEEIIYYNKEDYDSCSTVKPELPTMTSYKFNNKYNPNLNIDAVADTITNGMRFRLNSIGKWLTASFNLSDDKAVAYVDTVLQVSKETRQSFKKPVTYHVTYPGYNIIKNVKVQDEIWTKPVTGTQTIDVPLTVDMLYTNKPSVYQNEGLENLLDNNPQTIFHSLNGEANNATVDVNTYITIDLPEALDKMQIYYKCRPSSGYNPLIWDIYASNDGDSWTLVRTLDYVTDNMPRGGRGQEFTSSTIDLGASYSKIKILQTSGEYRKNHLVLAELRIKKVVETTNSEPEKIQDAKYETKRIPYGNSYKVTVDWLTDTPNSVPRIDIDIDGGKFVTSKNYYLNAKFRITGYGIYENFEDSVQIKGRGNTTWNYAKKPYRLKFAKKVKPFGLTKGKSWVLLANAQKGSLMANAISMKIGQMAGAEYTNHIIPVELYMNGQYMGSYMFTEKVGLANNSVDVDEDLGYLLELDTYYDEPYRFKTEYYTLPVNIKEPDLSEYADSVTRKNRIMQHVNNLCKATVYGNEIEGMLDMNAFARFMLANDLSLNQEICHPKSTYLFNENEKSENSKLKFGPIWDFDWAFGYEDGDHKYCYSQATASVLKTSFGAFSFFRDITSYESFKKQYYKVWNEFISNNSIDELIDFIESYYTFAKSSFDNNAVNYEWNDSYNFTESDKERHINWLKERKDYIYENLEKYDIDDVIYNITGDVNCNNQVTIHDVALITAYLNGNIHDSFNSTKADCDKDEIIDKEDASFVATLVREGDAPSATYWHSTPQAISEFYADDLILEINDTQLASLNLLCYDNEEYKAMQFDVTMPEGISLIDIITGDAISESNFAFTEKENNTYRITAYSENDECFSLNGNTLIELILLSDEIVNEDNCIIKISNAYFVDKETNESRINDYNIRFTQATGINNVGTGILIEGGECISITLLEPQQIEIYGVDGRKVKEILAKKGTTRIAIPAGIYLVNGEKVVVR